MKLFFKGENVSEEEYISHKVQKLLGKFQPEQRTPEWYEARKNAVTASNVACILTRDYDTVKGYIDLFGLDKDTIVDPKKSCSKYDTHSAFVKKMSDDEKPFTGNEYTFWGQKYEPVVQNIYQQMFGVDLFEFGLLAHDTDPLIKASPDGIDVNGVMVEIKCPSLREIGNVPPLEYYMQMQQQLEVCGLDLCRFIDCCFVEYWCEEDWKVDAVDPEKFHTFGILLQDPLQENTYIYPPPTVIGIQEFEDWAEQAAMDFYDDHLEFPKKVYYKLEKYAVINIPKEQGWYERNIARINQVWDMVVRARNGEKVAKSPNKRMYSRTNRTPQFKECCC